MNEPRAVVGDRVVVRFNMHDYQELPLIGTVKYWPSAEGDSWIIIEDNGMIHHVQRFDMITVVDRTAPDGGKEDNGTV